MKKNINKIVLFILLLPSIASADAGLDTAGSGIGLFEGTLPEVIRQIIAAILSLLALVFVILIIRGGLIWMTSVGNADKVREAKEIIVNATIGLVIVIASYAIVRFVFDSLMTGGIIGGGEVGGGGTP